MITVFPYEQLGHVNHGWLDTRHHFSFASYYDEKRQQFGALRVINDDIILPHQGFAEHPHQNMEIITFVREGAITHTDSLGNHGQTLAGDVQVMSAGSGVRHAEYNREAITTRLYQIWIIPNRHNVTPRWETKAFPQQAVNHTLPLLVSGREEDKEKGALFIYQDAAIYGGKIAANAQLTQAIKYQAYLIVASGQLRIENKLLSAGDGAEITNTHLFTYQTETPTEVLLIDVPS